MPETSKRGPPGSWRGATLAPFRSRVFFAIWAASLVSNFGSLIQAVGASWLMTSLAHSPAVVALVQACTSLPIMLLALPSGAIADIWDRRIIMLVAQVLMLIVSAVLAVMAHWELVTPISLLTLTFLLDCGVALNGPAWQSSVGEQVSRADLPAAVSLNTLSYNLARTAGPAVGGIIVATAGPQAAFVANSASYIALIVVLAMWRRPRPQTVLPPETIVMAMQAGVRYSRLSPAIRTVLVRGFAVGFCGSSIWALMPLIARDLLGGGPLTYGVLFGAFGGGAVVGALGSTSLRQRFRNEPLVRVAGCAFGLTAVIVALSPWLTLSLLAFAVGGASWVIMLSTFNITIQMSSPRWVVGRALALYQMVTFGGLAMGSWLWGLLAEHHGLSASLLISGVVQCLSVLLGVWLALPQSDSLNLDPSRTWMEHEPRSGLPPVTGPIVVSVEYRIAPTEQRAFVAAMREVRRIRRRDGARRWTLMQDLGEPEIWIERFHSPSWVEHLRHYHRFTVADEAIERRALAFHQGSELPAIRRLLERSPDEPEHLADRAILTDPNLPPATMRSITTEGGA